VVRNIYIPLEIIFLIEIDLLHAKTGSGQTEGRNGKRERFFRRGISWIKQKVEIDTSELQPEGILEAFFDVVRS